jgi:hypothetical protein
VVAGDLHLAEGETGLGDLERAHVGVVARQRGAGGERLLQEGDREPAHHEREHERDERGGAALASQGACGGVHRQFRSEIEVEVESVLVTRAAVE